MIFPVTTAEYRAIRRDMQANERTMREDGTNPEEPSGPGIDAIMPRLQAAGWVPFMEVRLVVTDGYRR